MGIKEMMNKKEICKPAIAFKLTFSKTFQLSLPINKIKKLKSLYAKGIVSKRIREKYLEYAGIDQKTNFINKKKIVERKCVDLLDDSKPEFALNKKRWLDFISSIQESLGFATPGEFTRQYKVWIDELIQEAENKTS